MAFSSLEVTMNRIAKFAAMAALVCLLGSASNMASAQRGRVEFRYRGGSWSHHLHAGWHRYWGGPSIGFYYAQTPVYVVRGYEDPYYYEGPDYWYSNPSFGLSFSLGGGDYGWYDGNHRLHRYHSSGYAHRSRDDYRDRDRDRDRYRHHRG